MNSSVYVHGPLPGCLQKNFLLIDLLCAQRVMYQLRKWHQLRVKPINSNKWYKWTLSCYWGFKFKLAIYNSITTCINWCMLLNSDFQTLPVLVILAKYTLLAPPGLEEEAETLTSKCPVSLCSQTNGLEQSTGYIQTNKHLDNFYC